MKPLHNSPLMLALLLLNNYQLQLRVYLKGDNIKKSYWLNLTVIAICDQIKFFFVNWLLSNYWAKFEQRWMKYQRILNFCGSKQASS